MRQAVERRSRLIRARKRVARKTIYYKIRRRISYRRRVITLRGLARISLTLRRRSMINRRARRRY